jgi:hypothetical protein
MCSLHFLRMGNGGDSGREGGNTRCQERLETMIEGNEWVTERKKEPTSAKMG